MIALPGVTIQSKIYESSASLVYRGIRAQDNLAVVVKLLKQDYPSTQELIRYRQEYEITRLLNLEGIVKAYSQQEYQRTLVMLLEDFGGESLEQWMYKRSNFSPIPLSTFLPLAINITEILSNIHTANVIHKDINPGNIVLNLDTGVVKIIDFGIATRFSRTNPTFKSPHGLEGTPAYLSPEQTGRMNRLVDYRTDFYSLGVTFYELLTGQLPFPTTDILELVHCHIAKQPIPPHQLNETIHKPVSEIIMKLMAKNAEDRYQSARGIKADLESCANQLIETGQINCIQLGFQDVSGQFQIPEKLYGREAEIEALLAAFDRVAGTANVGKACREEESIGNSQFKVEMMLVSGYAGIGKSTLVQEIYKPITQKRGYFISGKFDQLQRNIPYSALVDALRKLVQQLLSEPDEQLLQWRAYLLTALGTNGQIIIDVIPEVELIIGKQPPVPSVGATESQNRFHLIFGKFVRVFCSESHPLVIFLDDLQWMDLATLKLIELMLLDEETQFLFLIGAYRDNEVNSTHPLVLTLERLQKQGAVLREIILAPLTLEPLNQLIAQTLHQNADTVRSLAELVLHKTGGNPFFASEFLRMLYSENLLTFDYENLNWQWNIAQIQSQDITDNVVELMLRKLKKLPELTQQILRLAACIGAEFNLNTLSIICNKTPKTIFVDLLTAIQDGFIQPISELDKDLLIQKYRFLHDRVQQAAYALIDEAQKQNVHLQIGRNLLEKTLGDRLPDRLFEIVDHLNQGIEFVTDQAERNEIAKLNLLAGQKAKGAIAYTVAKKYLATSRKWLATLSWQTNYDLTLDLYVETTEIAYLCGEFEDVEQWARVVLQEAKTVLDSVKVYKVKIQANMAQGEQLKAINTALQVLQQFGISFPEKPTQSDVQRELDAIKSRLDKKPIENLSHLPQMTNPEKLAAMQILSSITIAAYSTAPILMPLLVSKQVNLSIQYGNASVSPFAYASFGLILCGMVGDIEFGYQFGQLALSLLSKLNTHALRARTLLTVYTFIIHWKEHARVLLKPLLEGYQNGLETGDLEFAAYCAYNYCFQSFLLGKELVEAKREMAKYKEVIYQLKQGVALTATQVFRQSVLNLMGRSVNPTRLIGEAYNEENGLPQHKAVNDGTIIFVVYLNKLFLCYLFYEYAQAFETLVIAESYVACATSATLVPLYYFYASLTRLATYLENNAQVQAESLEKIVESLEKMKQWADYAPMNYLHKYYLLQAETARVLGQLLEAEEFYEQAIQSATDNEYLQEEALAYELAANFYLSRGRKKFAQTYMKEAHYCYERWGATAKVKDLEIRYPQFFSQSSGRASTSLRTTSGNTSNHSDIPFDLVTVMKASQAISSEIELDHLLHSLMKILIENTGAQTGILILQEAGEWKIEVTCKMNFDLGENTCTINIMPSLSMASCLPTAIINYVIRTRESVVLNDATREGKFMLDPYIKKHQPQSILCAPLFDQGKITGLVYLENNLSTGAFSSDRIKMLQLLSGQAAIAITNAKLYAEVKERESRLIQFIDAMPIGVTVHTSTGHITYANRATYQLTDKADLLTEAPPEQISEIYQVYKAGTNQLYPTDQLPIFRSLAGETVTVDDIEVRLSDKTILVQISSTPVFDKTGKIAYAITACQDITERKQAEKLLADYNRTLEQQVAERTVALQESEAALRYREQELRLITDALPVCISYVDTNQRYRFVNRTYEMWFNCQRDEILGKSVSELLGEPAYHIVEPYINRALGGQLTNYEAEIPYPLGKKHISATFIPDFDSNAQVRGFYGLITDIGEQRNAALRERKRAEEASILEERNRMAREIHDTLAQAFTGILLNVGAATQVLTDDLEATQAHLEMIDELARAGLAEARRSVVALRPQLLEDGSLHSALSRLVAQMRSAADTAIIYKIKGTAYPMLAEVENNLLRIGQEALTNAVKYADACEVRVELVYENTQCILCVKDDGRGFGVGSIPRVGGFGLLGMSERAEYIGGQLTIKSQPGQGTEIIVTVTR
ncbi:MAG: AAA family ATPase [Mojavia pulchra JT2-VF2]|jgi:PAS domain S-box-containing protein|uniref:AAA family ATPase n=1 Tax=Mojavia pulchra JT2-VF2 TaxID=287848 RepID=A0A951UJK4_9NOST|nr:AAA family ATPase [Mojavia pulchra JT2-VF2]